MQGDFIVFITFFGGTLSLALASAHLVERNRTDAHYITSLFLFSMAFLQLYHGFMISGILFRHPHLALVHVPFLYMSAPLLYFYYQVLTRGDFKFRLKALYHFLPVILIIVLIGPFYLKNASDKLEHLKSVVGMTARSAVFPNYQYIILGIVLIIAGYACFVIMDIFHLSRKKLVTTGNTTFYSIILVTFNLLIITIYLTGYLVIKFLQHESYFLGTYYISIIKSISVIVTLEMYLILLIKWRYPNYIRQVKAEAQIMKYATSRIEKIDVDRVLERLKDLMENQKVFCDEDISLSRLADELDINPYQLSQILNERLNRNFNTYINDYRIRESEVYLLEDAKRSVMSISFAVGFNTVTSFYNAFDRIHHMTPAQYRKQNK